VLIRHRRILVIVMSYLFGFNLGFDLLKDDLVEFGRLILLDVGRLFFDVGRLLFDVGRMFTEPGLVG
jgi:hypothetical protein